jgi:hypothetical protein
MLTQAIGFSAGTDWGYAFNNGKSLFFIGYSYTGLSRIRTSILAISTGPSPALRTSSAPISPAHFFTPGSIATSSISTATTQSTSSA